MVENTLFCNFNQLNSVITKLIDKINPKKIFLIYGKGSFYATNSNSLDVKFEFNSGGKTDNLAFDWFFSMFYDPKLISDMQTLDSAPAVLSLAGEDLVVSSSAPEGDQTGRTGFVSPVDGHTEYFASGTNHKQADLL